MVVEAFRESYGRNVAIKGSSADMAAFFEGVTPCSYEDAIETFFEAQYSIEAMSVMTENAIMMESAGVSGVVTEGVISSFISAAIDKVKECATKIKQFAVAVVRKIVQFFKDLYAKATPIDRIMQKYGKNGVEYADIKEAVNNGYKIPGNLKLLTADAETIADDIIEKTTISGETELLNLMTKIANISEKVKKPSQEAGAISKIIEEIDGSMKSQLEKQKEKDKETFTAIGRLLSDNDDASASKVFKDLYVFAGGKDKTDKGKIEKGQWDVIKKYALNGQSKMASYRAATEKEAKDSVKQFNESIKLMTDLLKIAESGMEKDDAKIYNASKPALNKIITTTVNVNTYMASRAVMVMNKLILPLMRKSHNLAIATYVRVTTGVKAANNSAGKKKDSSTSYL